MKNTKNLKDLLINLDFSEEARIEYIDDESERIRLYSLGIYPGQKLKVLNHSSYSKIVNINGGVPRYALSEDVARKIIIKRGT